MKKEITGNVPKRFGVVAYKQKAQESILNTPQLALFLSIYMKKAHTVWKRVLEYLAILF